MSLSLCVLASGSSGNCSVVRSNSRTFLIDCGIPVAVAHRRLKSVGVDPDSIAAVVLTHLDRDHFDPGWAGWLVRSGVRVFCAAGCADEVAVSTGIFAGDWIVPFTAGGRFDPAPGVSAVSQKVAHDGDGSHAFVFNTESASLGFATDLGHVPRLLVERFCGVDLLAIESNYCPTMQAASGRPWFVQQRITGGKGHLSNRQAADALSAVFDRCGVAGRPVPRHVVLLHRSRKCNSVEAVRAAFTDRRLAGRLVLSDQFKPTPWLESGPAECPAGCQMRFAFA